VIFSETKVYTPNGWIEARFLKPGSEVFSWRRGRWVDNEVKRIEKGMARTAYSIICFDGVAPSLFRCTGEQSMVVSWLKARKAKDLVSGQLVFCSSGDHVFKAEATIIERVEHQNPEDTFRVLLDSPKNFLAEGFLCRAA